MDGTESRARFTLLLQNMEQCSSHQGGCGDTSRERAAKVAARTQKVVIQAMHKIGSSPGFDSAKCFVLMSGGVDSAVVAKLAYELLGVRRALTVIASSAATDEPWAHAVAESLPGRNMPIADMTLFVDKR